MASPALWLRDRVRRVVQPMVKRRLLAGRFASTPYEWREGSDSPDTAFVLLCLWNRKERLRETLDEFDRQTGIAGVMFFVWNNQTRDDAYYREVLSSYRPTGALARVDYVRSPFNLGAMARFYWARFIAKKWGSRPIIVIDDDEVVQPDFVSTALAHYDPAAVSAFWAFRLTEPGYWNREFAVVGGPVDHIGPGGIVMDAAVFLDDRFFTDLPDQYWLLDDIWLTHFAGVKHLELRKLPVEIEFVLDEFNQINQIGGQAQQKVDFWNLLNG